MFEKDYLLFDTKVHTIVRENNLNKIIACQGDQKDEYCYIFQTRREPPKVLEIYRETRDKHYPTAFIVPSPSPKGNEQTIPFDGQFALVVAYAKEIPVYVPFDKLISVSRIEIDEGKITVIGACGLEGLNILLNKLLNNNNLNNLDTLINNIDDLKKELNKYKSMLELRSYTIDLSRANLEDLFRFFEYNSGNNQNSGDGKMELAGMYIYIGEDEALSCKQSNIALEKIKILGMYM